MKEDELREVFDELRKGMRRLEVAISGDDLGNQGLLGVNRQMQRQMQQHEAEDEKRFSEAAKDRQKTQILLAKWGGGLAVLVFVLGIVASVIASVK